MKSSCIHICVLSTKKAMHQGWLERRWAKLLILSPMLEAQHRYWMYKQIWRKLKNIRRRQWHPTAVLLPGKSHGRRSLEGCSPWGCWGLDTTERLPFHFSLSCIGEGNGNPLQCSCLENPRDGGTWWAAIYGVTQSRTWLKQFSSSNDPDGSDRKGTTCNAGDLDSIPGLGRFPGGEHGNSLQYSCLESPHGQRNLVVYSPWVCKESDMTEWLSTQRATYFIFTTQKKIIG